MAPAPESTSSGSLSAVKNDGLLGGGLLGVVRSPIGKKLLTGITGLALITFTVVHLLGNLTLFFSAKTYNQLAYSIERLGPLTYAVEILLGAIALLHATLGIKIYVGARQARPAQYAIPIEGSANGATSSRQSLGARTMIISGLVLAAFLVIHLATFKFGTYYALPGSALDSTRLGPHLGPHRDLARLVFETFHKPGYTASYVIVLSLLGLHLRHGIWSALQSVGIATRPAMYAASAVLGGAIAIGFIGLPLAIYFGLIG
ncbi:MAG: succinate dehydrogenase cytochrome b subunit, partial [Cyanobacteria bacterium J06635_11]